MVANIIRIVALVIALAMVGFWTWYRVRILTEISRSDMDPKARRRWWWRVFLLRLVGILWYHEHLKKRGAEATRRWNP